MVGKQWPVHDHPGQGHQERDQAEQEAGHGAEGLVEEQVGGVINAVARTRGSGSRTVGLSAGFGVAHGGEGEGWAGDSIESGVGSGTNGLVGGLGVIHAVVQRTDQCTGQRRKVV